MAHGGPTGDPQVAADLSTFRVWQRGLAAGKVTWPLRNGWCAQAWARSWSYSQIANDGGPAGVDSHGAWLVPR
eukprot:2384602-Amphidinium_carterae.2